MLPLAEFRGSRGGHSAGEVTGRDVAERTLFCESGEQEPERGWTWGMLEGLPVEEN